MNLEESYSHEFTEFSNYYNSLKDWLKTQKFKRGVDIGLAWGMSATAFLETQEGTLLSIDLQDSFSKQDVLKRLCGDRWQFIQADSSTTLLAQKGKFDYIMIDGDHEYEPVQKDLEAAHKKLAKGGVIACDDYSSYRATVGKAIEEFIAKYNYSKESIPNHPNGAVILRRQDG